MQNFNRKKYTIKILIAGFFIVIAALISFFSWTSNKNISIEYQEKNDLKYQVFLKDNNFFETPSIGMNKTYITNLIDYFDIDFTYNINFTEQMTGTYTYRLLANISANKANEASGTYWEKEFPLSDEQILPVKNAKKVNIAKNLKVDYQKYNDLLNNFKEQYNLAADGKLDIKMIVKGEVKNHLSEKPLIINSNISLTVPLSQLAIEAEANTNAKNNHGNLLIEKANRAEILLVFKFGGIAIFCCSIFYILYIFLAMRRERKKFLYSLTVNKILEDYDEMIISLESEPKITKTKIVDVKTFEELVDVWTATKIPINYIEKTNESVFIIINDEMIWRFVIRKSDFLHSERGENWSQNF